MKTPKLKLVIGCAALFMGGIKDCSLGFAIGVIVFFAVGMALVIYADKKSSVAVRWDYKD